MARAPAGGLCAFPLGQHVTPLRTPQNVFYRLLRGSVDIGREGRRGRHASERNPSRESCCNRQPREPLPRLLLAWRGSQREARAHTLLRVRRGCRGCETAGVRQVRNYSAEGRERHERKRQANLLGLRDRRGSATSQLRGRAAKAQTGKAQIGLSWCCLLGFRLLGGFRRAQARYKRVTNGLAGGSVVAGGLLGCVS